MPESADIIASPLVRFPNFTDLGDLHSLSIIIQDLSLIYDVTTVAVLPGYGRVLMPTTRLGPRRHSPLRDTDLLSVKTVSLSSPLEIVFAVTGTLGVTGLSLKRLAVAAKAWIDVLAAGLDLQERKLALDQSRALAPLQLQLQEAQLRNQFSAERLRHVTAPEEYDLIGQARERTLEYEERRPFQDAESDEEFLPRRDRVGRHRKPADSMSNLEFAELLGDPMDRVLGYSGGELEVAGDEQASG